MRYYEAEPRPRRAGPGLVIGIGVAIVAIAAIVAFLWNPDDDSGGSEGGPTAASSDVSSTSSSESSIPVTATVVLTTQAPAPTTPFVALVDDCVQYVPTAIYFGVAEMQAFWDAAGATPEGLVAACERLTVDNPAELQRMSDAYRALQDLAASTTTG